MDRKKPLSVFFEEVPTIESIERPEEVSAVTEIVAWAIFVVVVGSGTALILYAVLSLVGVI